MAKTSSALLSKEVTSSMASEGTSTTLTPFSMPLISCQAKSPIQMEPNMESTQTQMFSTSRRLADTLNSCGWFPKKTESVLTCSMT